TPPRASTVRDDVPEALDEAVAWALEPDLERRCPDASALMARLGASNLIAASREQLARHVAEVAGDLPAPVSGVVRLEPGGEGAPAVDGALQTRTNEGLSVNSSPG